MLFIVDFLFATKVPLDKLFIGCPFRRMVWIKRYGLYKSRQSNRIVSAIYMLYIFCFGRISFLRISDFDSSVENWIYLDKDWVLWHSVCWLLILIRIIHRGSFSRRLRTVDGVWIMIVGDSEIQIRIESNVIGFCRIL